MMDMPERQKNPILMVGADDDRLTEQIIRMLDDSDGDLDVLLGFIPDEPDDFLHPYTLSPAEIEHRRRLFRRVLEQRHRLDGCDRQVLDDVAGIADNLALLFDPNHESVAFGYDDLYADFARIIGSLTIKDIRRVNGRAEEVKE